MDKFEVVIVGGGPAGISAALWCKRLDLNHVLIESNEQLGGQLFEIHNKIIDYPGALVKNGKEMQLLLEQQVEEIDCNVKLGCLIKSINKRTKKIIYSADGIDSTLSYEYLIIATGSTPRNLEVPGEKEMLARGEFYSATRDKNKFKNKNVAFVGGGDRAFEGALLLANEGATVYLIHRSAVYRARKSYQKELFNNKNITVLASTKVLSILGEDKVEAIEVINNGKKQTLEVEAIFVRIGVKPNSGLLLHQVDTDNNGYIIVNQQGETTLPNIYAIGDVCTHPKFSSISASVGQAMVTVKHISECLKSENYEN